MQETKISKFLSTYSWLLYFISAAFVLTMAIIFQLVPRSIYYLIGIALIIIGLLRIVPLLKTADIKLIKYVYLLEIALQVGFGIYFVYLANSEKESKYFGYFLGGIIYLRGLVHFAWCAVSKEKDNVLLFFTHLFLITIGSVIFARNALSSDEISIFLFFVGIICSIVLTKKGYDNYKRYRYNILIKRETKEIELEKYKNDEKLPIVDETEKEIKTEDNIIEKEQ